MRMMVYQITRVTTDEKLQTIKGRCATRYRFEFSHHALHELVATRTQMCLKRWDESLPVKTTTETKMVVTGIEPVTNGLLDQRATDCAKRPC